MAVKEAVDKHLKDGYAELDKFAMKVAKDIISEVNSGAIRIKSEMPYKTQYVLEKVIQYLEKWV